MAAKKAEKGKNQVRGLNINGILTIIKRKMNPVYHIICYNKQVVILS